MFSLQFTQSKNNIIAIGLISILYIYNNISQLIIKILYGNNYIFYFYRINFKNFKLIPNF
jgi:hypothetical protein